MRNSTIIFAFGLCFLACFSCEEKKKDKTIITHRIVKKENYQIKTIGDYKESQGVDWVGSTYLIEIDFKADKSLPTVSEGNQKYYDNKVLVRILRKDGSEFFSKTFLKTDFQGHLDSKTISDGALLGVVFNRTEENHLCFVASIGSPDMLSDAYVPLLVKISRFGDVTISKETLLEATEEDGAILCD